LLLLNFITIINHKFGISILPVMCTGLAQVGKLSYIGTVLVPIILYHDVYGRISKNTAFDATTSSVHV
jgi:hypothetical protein